MVNAEPEVYVTPTLSVPRSRYIEWLQGIRPLPGQDARYFFDSLARHEIFTEAEAAELLTRHRKLEQAESGAADPDIPVEIENWLVSRGWKPPARDT